MLQAGKCNLVRGFIRGVPGQLHLRTCIFAQEVSCKNRDGCRHKGMNLTNSHEIQVTSSGLPTDTARTEEPRRK
jgi:hypothetical protein